jgi:uncharacterized membrane protein HdeD (DUF308 family)
MPTSFPYFLSDATEELQNLHRSRGWFIALGILLIVVGVLAIGYPIAATVATVEFFGVLLLVAGIVEVASIIWARRLGSLLQRIVVGLLYLFLGVVMLDRPLLAATGYTLVMAVFFAAAGLFRIAFALSRQFSGWGWVVLSGSVSLFLGVLIWRELPEAALWVIGTFVGIDLLFNGWTWVMLGLAAGTIPAHTTPADDRPHHATL